MILKNPILFFIKRSLNLYLFLPNKTVFKINATDIFDNIKFKKIDASKFRLLIATIFLEYPHLQKEKRR